MQGFEPLWWLAGGQAIDAFLGYQSRAHGDIDIACLRRDRLAMRRRLDSLDVHCADPPGTLRPWRRDEPLPEAVHNIWCRPSPSGPWCLQAMLDENDGDSWVYRRSPAVRRPLATLCDEYGGHRFLAVEVQLLYKAPGAATVAKNQADFDACLPRLDVNRRNWLKSALEAAHPGHAWLSRL